MVIFKNIKIMEQIVTFWILVIVCGLAIETNSPITFIISFIGGLIYLIIRGKIKGWSLPKDVKDRHSW